MKLVLAEKPSVARSLAQVLGCYKKSDGYLSSDEYIVTWALGHLVELAQPATYSESYKRWKFSTLPILPEELKQEPIERTIDQFNIVKNLLENKAIDTFIIATDAGREGELVARWILKLTNFDKEIKRLWISSQTDQAIKEGFSNLKDGDKYLNLYSAAYSRAAADWYVGLNVTRALTTHYDAKMSAGRVQTPTLYLICEREEEIEKFSGKFYWTLKANFNKFNASYYPQNDSIRIEKQEDLKKLENVLSNNKSAKIINIEKTTKVEPPPLAYDLTELQRDANLRLSFSAKKTLDVLQRLYEYHKIVTYPRTDSRYITDDIVDTLEQRLKAVYTTEYRPFAETIINKGIKVTDRFVQNDLVSDHHAIIPTEQKVNLDRLSEDEKALWQLIVKRFFEVLEADYIYDSTTLTLEIDSYNFKARTTELKQLGWKAINRERELSENSEGFNSYNIGDSINLVDYKVNKLATEPPKRYNDATLLSAMEHAGRYVDDAKLKKNLSSGLGTPATRADIIEKLINNNYMYRSENNEFIPTEVGREIVRLVPPMLKSPALTGKWEARLEDISKGKEDSDIFIKDIKALTRELINDIGSSSDTFSPKYKESKKCPYCGGDMMKVMDALNRPHYICQKLSCSYEEMEIEKRVPLTKEELEKRPKVVVKKVKKVKVVAKADKEINKAAKVSSSAAYFQSLKTTQKTTATIKPKTVVPAINYKIEKVIEVVRESKLNNRKFNQNKRSDFNFKDSKYKFSNSESGGSFADFIKASENKYKKKKH
ncbi:MAG: DNA topoisomerase 3 [Pleomorphochaeta sp.]